MRRIIYTTNAIESVHMRLRKIIKTRGHFPTDEAATKLLWLALRNITADWSRATREWKSAMNQFAILYADRFKPSAARTPTASHTENLTGPFKIATAGCRSNRRGAWRPRGETKRRIEPAPTSYRPAL